MALFPCLSKSDIELIPTSIGTITGQSSFGSNISGQVTNTNAEKHILFISLGASPSFDVSSFTAINVSINSEVIDTSNFYSFANATKNVGVVIGAVDIPANATIDIALTTSSGFSGGALFVMVA